jgi:hypothetical protein
VVAIPAWVWRFGLLLRALIAGAAMGCVAGLLALLGSNLLPVFVIVFVAVTMISGGFMARRMNKLWPGAKALSGTDRVAVVGATRTGRDIDDSRLAAAVIDYSRALKAAADRRLWRWLMPLVGAVALVTAILDTLYSPVREAVISWLYFAFFPAEAWWWPRRQGQLVANAGRAEEAARALL